MALGRISRMLARFLVFSMIVLLAIATIIGSGSDLSCEGDGCILDDDINGIWLDNASSRITMISDHGWAVNIVENLFDDRQFAGRILARNGLVYDSFLSAYLRPDGRLFTVYSLNNGSVNSKDSMFLSYYDPYSIATDFVLSLHYDAGLTERPSSLALVSGIWSYSNSTGYTITLSIDSLGGFVGSDTNGCLYSGNLSIENPTMNIYQVRLMQSVSASGCIQYIPEGVGQGMLMDTVSHNDTLVIAVTGRIAALASASITFRLRRQ